LVATDNTPATAALRRDDRPFGGSLAACHQACPLRLSKTSDKIFLTGAGFLKRNFTDEI
jgi:hypothetical protein